MNTPVVVTDTGVATTATLASTWAVMANSLPRIVAFLLIVIIGWFVASLIAKGVAVLLRKIRFNELATRSGFSDFVTKMGIETDASGFLALVVKWFVRLIALVVAFDALGLPAVSDVLRQLLLWLPNLVVALIVLVLAGLIAKAVSSLVRGATAKAGFEKPEFMANIASTAVWVFATVVAVNQLGIATTLVNTLFMGVVGALALALGLAFGLGGRETAGQIVQNWHRKGQDNAHKLGDAAHEVAQTGRAASDVATGSPTVIVDTTSSPYSAPRPPLSDRDPGGRD